MIEKGMLTTPDNLLPARRLVLEPDLPTKTSEVSVPSQKRWRFVVTTPGFYNPNFFLLRDYRKLQNLPFFFPMNKGFRKRYFR